MDTVCGVAPGFSPACAALKGGATLSSQLLDTTLAAVSQGHDWAVIRPGGVGDPINLAQAYYQLPMVRAVIDSVLGSLAAHRVCRLVGGMCVLS